MRLRDRTAALLGIGAVGLLVAGCGSGVEPSSGRSGAVSAEPSPVSTPAGSPEPRVLSVRYTTERGAALRVEAVDPDGQIVGMELASPDAGVIADGGCGLGGPNGRPATWTLPVRRLSPGRHRFTLTLSSSSCDAAGRVQSPKRSFTVTVS